MPALRRAVERLPGKLLRLLLVAAFCLATPPVRAAPRTGTTSTQTENYPEFGRLVFNLPKHAKYHVVREADRMLFVFTKAGTVAHPGALPRNVVSVETGLNTAELKLAPDARPRSSRTGRTLVVDVFDPLAPSSRPEREAAAPAPVPGGAAGGLVPATASQAAAALAGTPPAKELPEAVPPPPQSTAQAGQTRPLPNASAPDGVAHAASQAPAATTPDPAASQPPSKPFLLPAPIDVGAAAFRRGPFGLVVLDRKVPPTDVPPGGQWLPGAVSMTLQVPLPQDAALQLRRVPDGWSVQQVRAADAKGVLMPSTDKGETRFPLPRPGRVVTLLDPVTGGTLLVGTSMADGGDAAFPSLRRTPDYALLPSWLGIAVEPRADRVELRSVPGGFALTGDPTPPTAVPVANSHRFDIPNEPAAALVNRLNAQVASAAASQPRNRTPGRVAAAQTMVALGMGAEAEALMDLVSAEDPQAAADAEVVGLRAVGAVMAGRLAEADGLDDPRLDGTDEIALWRGLRDRERGNDTPAARRIVGLASLALSYPASVRRLVWPTVAEAAVEAGAPVPDDKLSPFLRARQFERAGKSDEAIAAYEKAIAGPDQWDQVRAAERLTELRLASGRIGPADASAALERQAYAWRGDAREVRLRLRAAELLGVAGHWRPALDAMKAVETEFPGQHEAVRKGKGAVLQEMLAAEGSGMSPLDLVLLAADYADALPEGAQGAALARLLADKLMALDLPARAIPVLQGLMKGAPAGEPRAEFGLRLAQLLLDGGDPSGAARVLDASAAPGLPQAVTDGRELVRARIMAAQGDVQGAVEALANHPTQAADDLRAKLLASAGDWRGSLSALKALAEKQVPPTGPLADAAQALLLRQAAAAAQANDKDELRALAPSADRLAPARADLFRILTAAPLTSPSDLPRAAQELKLVREVAQQLSADGKR